MKCDKFEQGLTEAINDETAYKIVMQMVKDSNPIVAVIGVHGILKKIRAGSNAEYGLCNLCIKRHNDNKVMVKRNGSLCDLKLYFLNAKELK